jgi:hypothetical protein
MRRGWSKRGAEELIEQSRVLGERLVRIPDVFVRLSDVRGRDPGRGAP